MMVLCLVLSTGRISAAESSVKVIDKAPPGTLNEAIAKELSPKAIQVLEDGQALFELWLVKEVPLASSPVSSAKMLGAIKPTTLLGVASFPKSLRDYKDNDFEPGVYTMRLGLIPQDGDHMGVSDYPYYLVLVPAKHDSKPTGFPEFKLLVQASGQDTPTGHPVVLSLRPAKSAEGQIPRLNEPMPEHRSVMLKVPVKAAGSEAELSLVFELVFEGKGGP